MSHVEHVNDVNYRANADTALSAVHDTLKLGCNRPADALVNRLVRFESRLGAEVLPPLPTSTNRRASVTKPWGMLGNDQEGDCFFAGSVHTELLCSSVVGKPVELDEAATLRAYHDCTGPGDNGTDPIAGMQYWQSHGLSSKIAGFTKVSLSNMDSIRHAIHIFGTCGLGVNLPAAWKGQTTWKGPTNSKDLVGPWMPGSWDGSGMAGHWFPLLDFGPDGFVCLPWANTGFVKITEQAVKDFGMIAIAPVVPLWLDAQGHSPDLQLTIDWLLYDGSVLGGTTPPMPPKPITPPPSPPAVDSILASISTSDGRLYSGSIPRTK